MQQTEVEWFHDEDQNRVSGCFRAFGEVFGGIDTAGSWKKNRPLKMPDCNWKCYCFV